MDKLSIPNKMQSIEEVHKALKEIEMFVNKLSSSVATEAETEISDITGKTGDIQITQNADKSYTFEVRTEEGWKTPVIGETSVKFKDKPSDRSKPNNESIESIATEDESTGGSRANLNIFDEQNNKFVLPRPDYDTGWMYLDRNDANKRNYTFEHGLDFANGSPSLIMAMFKDSYGDTSGAAATNYVYNWKRFEHDATSGVQWVGADYRISTTTIFVQCYTSYNVYHTWQDDSGGSGTHKNWDDIDGRILLWK
jgi:hypothetical protein